MNDDIDLRGILNWFGGMMAVILGAILFCIAFVYTGIRIHKHYFEKPLQGPAALVGERLPPEPRLQASPPANLKILRAREDAILHSYGWVDKSEGIVRIPIEQAITLLAEENR